MAKLPKKAVERISAGLKRFQPILTSAKSRDVNESDTVVIVTDLLQEVFGYDKFTEVTSEHTIKGTFCDLAIKLDGAVAFLIEVKAIGLDLKEQFIKQAVDYAANQGVEWVALTNGARWNVYKVNFLKPIAHELVVNLDLLAMSPRNADHLELIGLLAKEGWQKANLGDYLSQRQALSRFILGALLLTDPVVRFLRRDVKKLGGIFFDIEEIRTALETEVLKREVLEGEGAEAARKQVKQLAKKAQRSNKATTAEAKGSNPPYPQT